MLLMEMKTTYYPWQPLLWSALMLRGHLSFPGNFCLHLRDIPAIRQCKKAIKPNSQPDPVDHQFPDSPAFPTMQSFSSLLYE
jgi:hypothetical protein